MNTFQYIYSIILSNSCMYSMHSQESERCNRELLLDSSKAQDVVHTSKLRNICFDIGLFLLRIYDKCDKMQSLPPLGMG